MKRIKEGKIKQLPFNLNYEECLIYYDGPILEKYNNNEEIYFSLWTDYNYKLNRWLYFNVNINDFNLYNNEKINLYNLIKNSTDIYIIDIDVKGNFKRIFTIKYENIPIDYLPINKPL